MLFTEHLMLTSFKGLTVPALFRTLYSLLSSGAFLDAKVKDQYQN